MSAEFHGNKPYIIKENLSKLKIVPNFHLEKRAEKSKNVILKFYDIKVNRIKLGP